MRRREEERDEAVGMCCLPLRLVLVEKGVGSGRKIAGRERAAERKRK